MYPSPIRKPPSPTGQCPPLLRPTPSSCSPGGTVGGGDEGDVLESKHVLNKDIVLQRKLGHGAMGEAWLAFCPTKVYPSPLVIKTICVTSDDALDRSLREVNALRQVTHPHIVKYFNAWIEQGQMFRGSLCIAMEYCEYGDLRSLIQHQIKQVQQLTKDGGQQGGGGPMVCPAGSFTNEQVMAFAAQMISAVAHCHANKVVHRDLKPENVLLTRRSPTEPVVALLGDFGLARDLTATLMFSRVGTPNYLSPEIARGEAYTVKTDIWAIGVMLYELMVLSRPFAVPKTNPPLEQDKYMRAIILRILNDDPIPALRDTAIANGFCPSLINMVIACLRKKERDRPSAVELLTTVSKTFAKYVKDNKYPVPAMDEQGAPATPSKAHSPLRRPSSPLPSARPIGAAQAAAAVAAGQLPPAVRVGSPLPAQPTDRQASPLRLPAGRQTPQRASPSTNPIAGSAATNARAPGGGGASPGKPAAALLPPHAGGGSDAPPLACFPDATGLTSQAAVQQLTRFMMPICNPTSTSQDDLLRVLHDDEELFLLVKLMVVTRGAKPAMLADGLYKLLIALRPEVNASEVVKMVTTFAVQHQRSHTG